MAQPRRTAPRRRFGRQGFSMVELMFALAIIAVSLMGVFSVILHTMRTKESMRELELAKEAATLKMEEMKARDFDEIATSYGTGSTGATFTVDTLNNPTTSNPAQKGTGTVSLYTGTANVIDVTVTVTWRGTHGSQTYTLRNILSK